MGQDETPEGRKAEAETPALEQEAGPSTGGGQSRRDFLRSALIGAGGAGLGLASGGLLARYLAPEEMPAETESFPRMRVARLDEFVENQPLEFRYPLEHPHDDAFAIRLGKPAFGGVGPDGDIVAFNGTCTHMGCPLRGSYKADHKILGPCPCHFSTFDLSRRGIVVLGQATEALPQVILEVEGGVVYATGVSRLIYGFRNNLRDAPPVGR
ncbi:MAG: arsenate reductase (azurin) small subunit [Thermoplasmata archaeon]